MVFFNVQMGGVVAWAEKAAVERAVNHDEGEGEGEEAVTSTFCKSEDQRAWCE